MTVLGMLLSGFLTIALWFEVSVATPEYFDATEKGLFVAAALMQTLLFLVSIIGFIGVVVKKLLFIRIYAYGQYVNFVLNVGFACYLFYTVSKFSKTAEYNICKAAIRDPNGEEQCNGFVNFIKYIISSNLSMFSLEGSIIVTRYLNNLKKHKYQKRQSRMVPTPRSAGFNRGSQLYSSVPNQDVDQQRLLSHSPGVNMHRPYASEDYNGQGEFNPYLNQTPRQSLDPNAVERGYGGGSWTYQDVAEAEKPPLPPSDQP
ncbi:hypothetical protein DL96DRAFT_1709360 [Flagelloscypha sp. PMI_526]|nr:hypothetical protein DL96DRAFT_1709360 [Flagelloscypha sp. PMI_526]